MYDIKPFDKEMKRILDQLQKDRNAYTSDIKLTRKMGKKYPELFDENIGLMDIGRIEKTRKSVITLRPGAMILPLPPPPTRPSSFKYRVYKIL